MPVVFPDSIERDGGGASRLDLLVDMSNVDQESLAEALETVGQAGGGVTVTGVVGSDSLLAWFSQLSPSPPLGLRAERLEEEQIVLRDAIRLLPASISVRYRVVDGWRKGGLLLRTSTHERVAVLRRPRKKVDRLMLRIGAGIGVHRVHLRPQTQEDRMWKERG